LVVVVGKNTPNKPHHPKTTFSPSPHTYGSTVVKMKKTILTRLVVVLALVLAVSANARSPHSILMEPQPLARYGPTPMEPLAFSWSNCGAANDPTQLQFLQVSPDPIVLGGNVTVVVKGYLSQDITATSGVTVSLEIYKKFLGAWIYVPCLDGVGSCTITDICDKIKYNPDKGCPVEAWGIPCECPFKAGLYSITPPGFTTFLKNPNLSWLTDGDIKVLVTVNDAKGTRMACVQIIASLTSV